MFSQLSSMYSMVFGHIIDSWLLILSSVSISTVASLAITDFFIKVIDRGVKASIRKYDIILTILLVIVSNIFVIPQAILFSGNAYNLIISNIIILIVLNAQSIFDRQTKEIYTLISIVGILGVLGVSIYPIIKSFQDQHSNMLVSELIVFIAAMVLLFIMVLFRGLGSGDFLLYIMLEIYFFSYSSYIWFLLSILISMGVYLIRNIPNMIKSKKSIIEHTDFTTYILIGYIIISYISIVK